MSVWLAFSAAVAARCEVWEACCESSRIVAASSSVAAATASTWVEVSSADPATSAERRLFRSATDATSPAEACKRDALVERVWITVSVLSPNALINPSIRAARRLLCSAASTATWMSTREPQARTGLPAGSWTTPPVARNQR